MNAIFHQKSVIVRSTRFVPFQLQEILIKRYYTIINVIGYKYSPIVKNNLPTGKP